VQVNIFEHLKLTRFVLKLVEALRLVALILDELLLFPALGFDIVLQPFDNLFLRRDLVLSPLQLLLEYLFTLLGLGQLLPEHGVGAELLLEVVNLVVMLLLFDCFFKLR